MCAEIETTYPKNLVLDLRFDVGGNIDETRDLARIIATNVRGRIYVLMGPYIFFAGIVMAAATKHDGGERVIIVGNNVSDRLRWWSEGEKSVSAKFPLLPACDDGSLGFG